MSTETFQELLARSHDGDEVAIARLIELCGPEIEREARAMLGPLLRPYLDSVDVAQSVRIALLQGLRREKLHLADSDQLIGLAVRMVQRKVADHWQTVRRRRQLLIENVNDCAVAHLPLVRREVPTADDPSEIAAANDQFDRLLAELKREERRLIEFRALGYSTAAAARELGRDSRILRVQLSRLRKRLREKGLLAEWL